MRVSVVVLTALVILGCTGQVDADLVAGFRITEINYNPYGPTPEELAVNPELDNDDFEFLELQNTSDQAVDLTGVGLSGGIEFHFDNTVLDPAECVLVVRQPDAFELRYGTGLNVAGQYGGRLDNGGQVIRLVDSLGLLIQDFEYDDLWHLMTDGFGHSLEVLDTMGNYNDPGNWRASPSYGGSPGVHPDPIPEPSMLVLLVAGAAGLLICAKRPSDTCSAS